MTVTHHDIRHCQTCHQPILWAYTTSDRKIPVNAETDPNGSILITRRYDGQLLATYTGPTTTRPPTRRRPHLATCPTRKHT